MKKIFLASTALVAFAGAAAAEISLTGNAEMGILVGDGGVADTENNVEFFTDIDVTFTLSGETDNGLTFGASVDLDEGGDGSDASDNNRDDGGATIFISGGFGTLTMGDTDGALDWALTEVAFNTGSLNDDETEHGGYLGSYLDGAFDGQILRYDYSFGNFGVAVSAEVNDSNGDDIDDDGEGNFGVAVGMRYGLDLGGTTVNFGLGYQQADNGNRLLFTNSDVDALGVSVSATFGAGFTAGMTYTAIGVDNINGVDGADTDVDHFSVGVGYTAGAISASANYGHFDFDDFDDVEGFGLSAGYDLGGGAIIQAGYGSTNANGDLLDRDTFSFGVRMNF